MFSYLRLKLAVAAIAIVFMAGCGAPEAEFQVNWPQVRSQEVALDTKLDSTNLESIQEVLRAMFGTPDEPIVPAAEGFSELFNMDKLKMAAGAVGTDESGRPHGL